MSESANPERAFLPAAAEAPQVVCFEGTDTPKLTLADDSGWLAIAAHPSRVMDEAYVAELNHHAEVALGGIVARKAAATDSFRSSVLPFRAEDAAMRARNGFYRTLLAMEPNDKPNTALEEMASLRISPVKIIVKSRLLYEFVGEHFDDVILHGTTILRADVHMLRERITALVTADIDPGAVILGRISTLANKYPGESMEGFLERARQAAKRYEKQLRTAHASAALVMPERSTGPAPVISRPERYAELSGITGLEIGLLESGFPELGNLTAGQYNGVVATLEVLSDNTLDRALRIRDIIPHVPKPPEED